MRVLLAIEGVLMDNKAVFRRSTHPLHHTRKLVHLCHHTRGSCSSQRGQGSPKALQRPCVLPKLVAAGHAWSSAAGVFTGRGRNRKNIFYFYFHSCWWEGCLRPIWREAGWPGEAAPGADTLPPPHGHCQCPSTEPISHILLLLPPMLQGAPGP